MFSLYYMSRRCVSVRTVGVFSLYYMSRRCVSVRTVGVFSLYYMSRRCEDCWCVFTILHVEAV